VKEPFKCSVGRKITLAKEKIVDLQNGRSEGRRARVSDVALKRAEGKDKSRARSALSAIRRGFGSQTVRKAGGGGREMAQR